MIPKSPSEHATELVFEQSRKEIMDKLFVDLERMLTAHAEFDRWLNENSSSLRRRSA